MKKQSKLSLLFVGIVSMLVLTLSLNIGLAIALYGKYVSGNGTYGQVSLRSYYECGSGTIDDPFVITRPRHLYNFSRLQGLGVYGEKKYFQLGKVNLGGIDSNNQPMCYADDSSSTQKPYLDMSGSDIDTNPINAIGSEALPFYGEFDGQNVEIKDLNVYASPEDAGLFGYTAHGSIVQNLFLSNVTIHALGYTSDYADLYSPESTIGNNAYFLYDPNDNSQTTNFSAGNTDNNFSYFYANNTTDFEFTAEGSSAIPSVSIIAPANSYTFSSLLSGDLITFDGDEIVPNLDRVFEFFKEKKNEATNNEPIQASSSASLIVSSVDRYGQKHSKVLLTLEFDFTLDSPSSNFVSMGVRLSGEHGNNIGLIAGHCDGTVTNCYVYNGAFEMNNGGAGYNSMSNGSNLGLIGLVGGTVQNILANEADVGAKEGKNIGVLDFTTIYRDIIDSNSFANSGPASGVSSGVTFNPASTTKYEQYLRHFDGQYITLSEDSVSFKGRTIVTNTDLGVFTVATDPLTGAGAYSGDNLERSAILTEDLTVNGNYYIYYSTGEYNKAYQTAHGGSSFDNYLDSYNTYNSAHILPGFHFPRKEQITRDSFMIREARQNYIIRFQLDPNYRRGKGFYFSDVDTDTDGGAFLGNYFNYKLVDQDGYHIPLNDNKCGLMLKNNLRQEVGSLSASFTLPDLTKKIGNVETQAFCLEDDDDNKYVGNMVNFEIKNDLANVTVIAAPVDPNPNNPKTYKSAALGVYKLDDGDFEGSNEQTYDLRFTQRYNNPDYAFFMPDDNHLAYFDYQVNGTTGKGELGTFVNNTFIPGSHFTHATVANEYGVNEYGYSSGKTRLFAHTFCLPRGRYCLGSASKGDQCVPKIFYICAQGQDDGQFDFDDTVFSSNDRVEDVDFINAPRFETNGTETIVIEDISTYNPNSQTDGDKLDNHRCYVALVNSKRSSFGSSKPTRLTFTYDSSTGKFVIQSYTYNENTGQFVLSTGQDLADAVTYIAVDNYNHSLAGDPKELTVSLFGNESTGAVIVYPVGS